MGRKKFVMSDVKIRFLINKNLLETMTEEEYEAIEMAQDGQARLYRLRPLMARFMVDEHNKPLAHEIAKKQLGKVPMGEFAGVTTQFTEAFRELAVPKASASLSGSHSEASSEVPSPDGL